MTQQFQQCVWIAAIIAQLIAAVRCKEPFLFRSWLILTIPMEAILLVEDYGHVPGSFLYDYTWRAYAMIQIPWVAGIVYESFGFIPALPSIAVSGLATAVFAATQSHSAVWPHYWMEPVFCLIAWSYCFLGIITITKRSLDAHASILAAWLLFTAALYSGASMSVDRVGVAVSLLNCVAFLGWSCAPRGSIRNHGNR